MSVKRHPEDVAEVLTSVHIRTFCDENFGRYCESVPYRPKY